MLQIIYKDSKPIGWSINPTTPEEQLIAAQIRDLQFFGFNETNIEYDGLTLIDESKGKTLGNIKTLSWIQKQYQK